MITVLLHSFGSERCSYTYVVHCGMYRGADTPQALHSCNSDFIILASALNRCLACRCKFPTADHAPGFSRYATGAFHHEAAYDAWLTGNVFLRLSASLTAVGSWIAAEDVNSVRKSANTEVMHSTCV